MAIRAVYGNPRDPASGNSRGRGGRPDAGAISLVDRSRVRQVVGPDGGFVYLERMLVSRATTASIATLALASSALVLQPARAEDVLLIPDSGLDKVWSFSPVDGAILSDSFIAADGILSQPIQIAESGNGTLLITDEVANSLFEYSMSGAYIRTLIGTIHGTVGLYGVCVHDGYAYVTQPSSGDAANRRVWRVKTDGSAAPEVWLDCSALGIAPRGIERWQSKGFDGFLLGDSEGDNLIRVALDGTIVSNFVDSDGVTGIDFPQQIHKLSDGGCLVAGFTAPSGLYTYDSAGTTMAIELGIFVAPRGVHVLENGEFLYTGGTRVQAWNQFFSTDREIVNSDPPGAPFSSFRWITRVTLQAPPCPADIDGSGLVDGADLAALLTGWGGAGVGDINGSGEVDAADLAILLGAWGACG